MFASWVVHHPGLEELAVAVGGSAVDVFDEHEVGVCPDVPSPTEDGDAVGVGEGGDGVHQGRADGAGAVLIAGLGGNDGDAGGENALDFREYFRSIAWLGPGGCAPGSASRIGMPGRGHLTDGVSGFVREPAT